MQINSDTNSAALYLHRLFATLAEESMRHSWEIDGFEDMNPPSPSQRISPFERL